MDERKDGVEARGSLRRVYRGVEEEDHRSADALGAIVALDDGVLARGDGLAVVAVGLLLLQGCKGRGWKTLRKRERKREEGRGGVGVYFEPKQGDQRRRD